MFKFQPSDYRNFLYGVVPKSYLERVKQHAFALWDEELILYWNNGDVRCYQNYCPHYGLPLDRGRIEEDNIVCGFHAWRFKMSDGVLVKAPLNRKQPKCKLKEYKTFVKGGIVFVYPGNPQNYEEAKRYTLNDVIDNQISARLIYEVPFYIAMNSSMDFPHHASHTLFYTAYGIFRALSLKNNPLRTTYTPIILHEDETCFKYKITENEVEVTVYPFCMEYNDIVSMNRWQIFVMPTSRNSSQYFINLVPQSKSLVYRSLAKLGFYTIIKRAMVEDQGWLKSSYKNWKKGNNMKLCGQDFGLKKYMKKFFIHPSNSTDSNNPPES